MEAALPLRVATWNCNALFMSASSGGSPANRKFAVLHSLVSGNVLALLQETHGHSSDLSSVVIEFPSHPLSAIFWPKCREAPSATSRSDIA